MHLAPLIRDLAVILGVAGLVTILFRKIRQPVVLGYLVAGMIVGPHTPPFPLVTDMPNIQILAELGVIFLMFSLGLEFSFHKLARVGGAATVTALIEVFGMVAVGYGTGKLLGWNHIDSLFLGGILSVSSTTIIIKAFEELGLKSRRFAELVFGVLIVEDLVAILLLAILSTLAISQNIDGLTVLGLSMRLFLVVGSWFLVGYFLIPPLLRHAARYLDGETLTVLSSGLCLLLVVLATHFHYSAALGAFLMGSILAETPESERINHLIQPLRDLFGAVFFVSVGMLVDPRLLVENAVPVVVITLVTIFGKIATSTAGALLSRQPRRRSVQVGFSLAQIGEFSFIIATLGATLKITSPFLYPIAVSVSVITTFITPYLIRLSGHAVDHYFPKKDAPQIGAPWDLHLTRIRVHPNSSLAGKTLRDAALRTQFGLNVLVILRGEKSIASPGAGEMLFPADELLVIGSDDQLDAFRRQVELPSAAHAEGTLGHYGLKQIAITQDSPLSGKAIRAPGIREKLGGLVVGLERAKTRKTNPDPQTVLEPGDLLWVVEERR